MTLSEVEVLMQELGRHVNEQTQILFGAVVDARLGDRLTVTIISSLAAEDDLISQPQDSAALISASAQPQSGNTTAPEPQIHIEPEPAAMEPGLLEENVSFEEPVAAEAPPAPAFVPNEPEPLTVATEESGSEEGRETASRKVSAGETGNFAIRAGHPRTI